MSQTPKLNMFPIGPATGKSGAAPGWAIIGIFVILMFAGLVAARDFLMPVVTALLLFMMFIPLRRHLERWHISARVTAGLVVVLMLAVMILLLGALRGPVTQVFDNLPEIGRHLESKFEGVFTAMRDLEKVVEESLPAKPETAATAPAADPAPSRLSLRDVQITEVLSYLLAAPAIVGQMLFTLVLLFFLLASGDLFYLKIVQSFDTMGDKRRAYLALREIEDSLSNYLGAITLINAVLGLCIGAAMAALGMPVPVMFALLGFVFNFVPYLGALVGIFVASMVALAYFDGFLQPLLVALAYFALTSIEGQLVTPTLVSRRLRMNTVVVFASVALWAWLWSIVGMLIAVPLLVTMRVVAEHIPGMQKFANFLSAEDVAPVDIVRPDDPAAI